MNPTSGLSAQQRGKFVQLMVADALALEDPARCWFAQVPAHTFGKPGAMGFRRGGNAVDFVGRYLGCPVAFDVKSWRYPAWDLRKAPAKERLRLAGQLAWLEAFSSDGHSCAGLLLVNTQQQGCYWVSATEHLRTRAFALADRFIPWASPLDIALGRARSSVRIGTILQHALSRPFPFSQNPTHDAVPVPGPRP